MSVRVPGPGPHQQEHPQGLQVQQAQVNNQLVHLGKPQKNSSFLWQCHLGGGGKGRAIKEIELFFLRRRSSECY